MAVIDSTIFGVLFHGGILHGTISASLLDLDIFILDFDGGSDLLLCILICCFVDAIAIIDQSKKIS